AAALARAGQLLAVVIDLAEVLGLHEALGHHRRRTQDLAVVEPHGDVAVVGRGEAPGVHAPADLANLFLELVFVHDALRSSRLSRRGGPCPPYLMLMRSRMQAQ